MPQYWLRRLGAFSSLFCFPAMEGNVNLFSHTIYYNTPPKYYVHCECCCVGLWCDDHPFTQSKCSTTNVLFSLLCFEIWSIASDCCYGCEQTPRLHSFRFMVREDYTNTYCPKVLCYHVSQKASMHVSHHMVSRPDAHTSITCRSFLHRGLPEFWRESTGIERVTVDRVMELINQRSCFQQILTTSCFREIRVRVMVPGQSRQGRAGQARQGRSIVHTSYLTPPPKPPAGEALYNLV